MIRLMRRWTSVIAGGLMCALALVSTSTSASLAAGTDAVFLDVGDYHSCVALADGTAWCWGYAIDGEIGDGTTGDPTNHTRTFPTQVLVRGGGPLTNVAKVTAGGESSCALKKTGTLMCWGDDGHGQLGDGTTGNSTHLRLFPVTVKRGGSPLADVRSVSTGTTHTCAALNDGSAWCWGDNSHAQLGDGTTGDPTTHNRLNPVRVRQGTGFLKNVVQVSSGDLHTCALTGDGSVWCWGYDIMGAVGDGTTGDSVTHLRLTARRVLHGGQPIGGVTQISASDGHACARSRGGSAWCWGDDSHGQLGDGTTGDPTNHVRLQAVRVRSELGPLTNVVNVGAGAGHSCARDTDGHGWCWGFNVYGQLGNGSTGDSTTHNNPLAFIVIRQSSELPGVIFVTGGQTHSCALGPNGSVWCWGRNANGELGRGTTDMDAHTFARKVLFF